MGGPYSGEQICFGCYCCSSDYDDMIWYDVGVEGAYRNHIDSMARLDSHTQ
jgi:hypothetical protein